MGNLIGKTLNYLAATSGPGGSRAPITDYFPSGITPSAIMLSVGPIGSGAVMNVLIGDGTTFAIIATLTDTGRETFFCDAPGLWANLYIDPVVNAALDVAMFI